MSARELVGRARELSQLLSLVADDGPTGATLVVTGEPGIGKTALLEAASEHAGARGALVVTTVGVESESELPFAGLHQLLSGLLVDADSLPATLRDGLLTAFGLRDGPQPTLFLVAEASLALLVRARAGRPVLVVADDVQWLDSPTHEVVTFLGHRAPTSRLVVVGASRANHDGPFVTAGFSELTVTGLDGPAAELLLARAAPTLSDVDRRRISAEAQGNPLALLELPKTWHSSPTSDPPALSTLLERAFAGRLTELPAATRDALLVAAVDSTGDVETVLTAVSALRGGPPDDVVLAPAVDVGLVLVDARRLRFRHPLVRSGVLQHESVVRRQSAHRALADTLATGDAEQKLRRVWHRAQSIVGPDDRIADELEAGAAESLRRGAVMAAVAGLERAAELSRCSAVRGHRLLLAAEQAFGLGRTEVVRRLVDDASRTDLTDLDWARMQWLREIFDDGQPGDGVRVSELCAVARRSAEAGDVDLALNLLLGAALRCWWADTGAEARAEVAHDVTRLSAGREDPRGVAALAVAEPVRRAREVADAISAVDVDTIMDGDSLRLLGMAAHAIGDPVRATDILDRAESVLRAQVRLGLLPQVLGMQVHIRHELGDWDGASSALREVDRLALETGQPIWSLNNAILDAQSRALRGRWQDALDILAGAEIEAVRRGLNDTLALVCLARGTALIAAGRPDAAFDCLRRPFDVTDPAHHERESFASLGFLAEAAHAAGRAGDARVVLDGMERLARVTPSSLLRVHLAYARAVLAPETEAEVLFRAALGADLSRWPWSRARLEAAFGSWLVAHDRAAEGRRYLRPALATFDALGARTWADSVRGHAGSRGSR